MDNERHIPKAGKISIGKKYTVLRLPLDSAGSEHVLEGANLVDFSFKSLWVSDSSNKEFDVKVKIDHKEDRGDSIALKPNMSLGFDELQNGCVFTYPAQTGKWIEITFAHDSIVRSGSIEISQGGTVGVIEGNDYTLDLKTVTTSVAQLVEGNAERLLLTIENRGGVTLYLGDKATCEDVDYKDKCLILTSGDSLEWKNRAGLYARTETTTNSNIFFLEELQ